MENSHLVNFDKIPCTIIVHGACQILEQIHNLKIYTDKKLSTMSKAYIIYM